MPPVDPLGKKMNAMVRDTQHYKRVISSMQTFNENKDFADLCFVCARGHKVYAHKILFCSVSTFLKKMILDIQDHLQTIYIHLPDIESQTMEVFMEFFYEGSVRINKDEYEDFQTAFVMLGIVLATPEINQTRESNIMQVAPQFQHQLQVPQQQLQVPQQQIQVSQQQLQAPQLVFMPTGPNAQGQVQYVMAAPNQMNQTQVLQQAPLMSPVVSQQPPGQMVQNGTQGNMMHMVQQNNAHVVPMNQLVAGGQMMQCSTQMVMQGNQQGIGMQAQVAQGNYATNQPIQQQPQYVMASNTNQQATNRTTTQYSHPRAQGMVRNRPSISSAQMQQPNRINNEDDGGHANLVETIKSILQENMEDPTPSNLLKSLEQRLGMDLSHKADELYDIFKTLETEDAKPNVESATPVSESSVQNVETPVKLPSSGRKKRRKQAFFSKSDDEEDEDFVPKQMLKKKTSRRRKKSSN